MRAKRLNIALSLVVMTKVKELSKEKGISISEIIRNAIDFYYIENQKTKYGRYRGFIKSGQPQKALRQEQEIIKIKTLEAMSDDELTDYLREVGYIPPDEESMGFRIITRDNQRFYRSIYFDSDTGRESGGNDRFDWEELLADLRKNKII